MSAAIEGTVSEHPIHTISLFVNNVPGVLVRVSLVFSRRGFNIESMVVPLAGVPLTAGWRLVGMARTKPAAGGATDAQRLIAGLQRELVEPSLFRRLQRRMRARRPRT